MIQLVYEPAFDALHGMFRALRLLDGMGAAGRISREHFRILDFYLLFPERAGDVRLRTEHRRRKTNVAKSGPRIPPYGPRPDDRSLLQRMQSFQVAALESLVSAGYFSAEAYAEGWVEGGSVPVPPELKSKIETANSLERELVEFLRALSQEYVLEGDNGLKARTGLMEYRYDAV